MSTKHSRKLNPLDQEWLRTAGVTSRVDPRQRYKINLLRLHADADALADSVDELDQTLTDLRKIRNVCASLPRSNLVD